MKVLVTGGAGFIGSHLTQALIARGDTVRIFDNFSTGNRLNIADFDIELVEGDVADYASVVSAAAGCDAIVHLAALVSVPQSISNPALNHHSNVNGTFHIFEAARHHKIRRVVYASSAAVYGDVPELPCRENGLTAPVSPYGAAKLMAEQYAAAYNKSFDISCIGLRFFNVFGPRQDPSSPYSGVLSIFCRAAHQGLPIKIFGDGKQTRDFIFVADLVQGILRALDVPARADMPTVFNLGRGEQTSLLDLVDQLVEVSGRDIDVSYDADRPGDIRFSVADITRAKSELGFEPQVTVLDGLAQTFRWFNQ